jgi:hypothetical protein
MPIEPGASWFSPKCVEAQRLRFKSGGKALFRCGLPQAVPNRDKLRIPEEHSTSETVGDKLHRRKGNSPDHQLRPPNERSVIKEVGVQ